MNKTQKMKTATRKTQNKTVAVSARRIITAPWRACKAVWKFIVRVCRAFWNWVKEISIVGMVNLTLLVAIIVLGSCLIANVLRCDKNGNANTVNAKGNVVVLNKSYDKSNKFNPDGANRNVVKRADVKVKSVKPKIISIKKVMVAKTAGGAVKKLPTQRLYGDVIVDVYPDAPVLKNGVNVDGNLYIQNMRKYTLPCDAKVTGHLFIRNVGLLQFCGRFDVSGNIYVNRQSAFGPIPQNARVGGQIVL